MFKVKEQELFSSRTAKTDRQSLVALECDFLKYLTRWNNYLMLKSGKVWQLCIWVSLCPTSIQILLEIKSTHELSY